MLIERIDIADETGTLTEQVVLKPRNIRIEFPTQAADGTLNTTPRNIAN